MENKENLLSSYTFLDQSEMIAIFKATQDGLGREPTDEELSAVLDWATKIRVGESLIKLINKELLEITLMKDEQGNLTPAFKNNELGERVRKEAKNRDANLVDDGEEILKSILNEED